MLNSVKYSGGEAIGVRGNSGERSSSEFQVFTDSGPKRRGRKSKRTLETFKSELIKDPGFTAYCLREESSQSAIFKREDDLREAIGVSYENRSKLHVRLQTFHFHFSEELVEHFTYFATLHRFDERKAYKENWTKWIAEDDVSACIAKEVERLTLEGYSGDILDKMFKSVRYYYRKKPFEAVPPKTRKPYESFPQYVLHRIDAHILDQIRNHTNFKISGRDEIFERDEVSYKNGGLTTSFGIRKYSISVRFSYETRDFR